MKSSVIKRPIMINGRTRSISLEHEFRDCLLKIAAERKETLSSLVLELMLIGKMRTYRQPFAYLLLSFIRIDLLVESSSSEKFPFSKPSRRA